MVKQPFLFYALLISPIKRCNKFSYYLLLIFTIPSQNTVIMILTVDSTVLAFFGVGSSFAVHFFIVDCSQTSVHAVSYRYFFSLGVSKNGIWTVRISSESNWLIISIIFSASQRWKVLLKQNKSPKVNIAHFSF